MRRHLVIALAIVVALAAVAMFGLLYSLRGGRLHSSVESRLSSMLGQPVAIGQLNIELFPRVAFSGGNVRVGEARAQAPALNIRRVRVLPRVRSLWAADVVIEEVELDGFVVSVLRDRQGRWHIPPAVPAPTEGGAQSVAIEHVRIDDGRVQVFDQNEKGSVTETATIHDLETAVEVVAGGLRLVSITSRIGRANISGEARTDAAATHVTLSADAISDDDLPVFLRLLGTERPAFLRLAEPAAASIAVRVNRATSRFDGKGALRAPHVLLGTLRLQRFEAPFVIQQTKLEFKPTAFAMYGGTHEGIVTVDLAGTPPEWTTDSRVSGLTVGEFLRALTGRDQRLDGTASITGGLRGRIGEPLDRTVRGRVHMVVTDGVIRNFPLLAAIDGALRVGGRGSDDTPFERLAATLSVAAGQATTNDLVLQSGDVRVSAEGRIGADRSVALRGRAAVSADRVARAAASVREIARLRNTRGEIELPLTISGSLDAPAISVDVKTAISQGVADEIRRRLRRVIP